MLTGSVEIPNFTQLNRFNTMYSYQKNNNCTYNSIINPSREKLNDSYDGKNVSTSSNLLQNKNTKKALYGTIAGLLGITSYIFLTRKCEANFFKRIAEETNSYLQKGIHKFSDEFTAIAQNIQKTSKNGHLIDGYDINPHNANKYIIFCPGIDSPMVTSDAYKKLVNKNHGLIQFDYCGIGNSQGEYGHDGCMESLETMYNYLTKEKKISPKNISIVGHSLGTGIGAEFAKKHEISSLILVNPFDNFTNATKQNIESTKLNSFLKKMIKNIPNILVPIKSKYDNIKNIKNSTSPVLIISSKDEHVLPIKLARNLAEKCNKNKNIKYIETETGDHYFTPEKYNLIQDFLN